MTNQAHDYDNSDDCDDYTRYRRRIRHEWFLLFAFLIAIVGLLAWPIAMVATLLAGETSPAHAVAIAEAYAKSLRDRRRDLPNDFIVEPVGPVNPVSPVSPVRPGGSTPDAGQQPEPEPAPAPQRLRYHVTVYTMDHCIPCREMRARHGDGDDSVRLNWTLADAPAGFPALRPLTVWRNGAGQQFYIAGATSPAEILAKLESPRNAPAPAKIADETASADDHPAAVAVAGSIRARHLVEPAIAAIRQRLPIGSRVSLRWHRSGLQTLPLLRAGAAWDAEAVFGQFGRFEASTDANIPIQSVAFSYKVDDDTLTVFADPISLHGFLRPSGTEPAESVGVAGFDPMTVLTILSVLRSLWQVLNPSVDLELSGTVAASMTVGSESIRFEFSGGPRVRAKAFWQWLLEVQSVDVSGPEIVLRFAPQPGSMFPVKERRFKLE